MFNTFIYTPFYNVLVFLIDVIPGGEVGLAVIALTVLVRFILFPLAQKSARTQIIMRDLQPKIEELKKKYKKEPQVQAQKTLALYKEKNINPFAGIFLLLVQLPIIFGLYFIFLRGGLPTIDVSHLYNFTAIPTIVDMEFLGIDMAAKSILLALLAAATQFIQINLLTKKNKEHTKEGSIMERVQNQMRFTMPIIVGVVAYSLSALIALYWTTSNIFMIIQEWFIKRRLAAKSSQEG